MTPTAANTTLDPDAMLDASLATPLALVTELGLSAEERAYLHAIYAADQQTKWSDRWIEYSHLGLADPVDKASRTVIESLKARGWIVTREDNTTSGSAGLFIRMTTLGRKMVRQLEP